jgi:hypothetical protein
MTDTAVSPMAQELVNAGAIPEMPDYAAMLAEQNSLLNAAMSRIKALETERGIPSDPVDGAVKNLAAHVTSRAAQLPNVDFTEIQGLLNSLPADSTAITPAHSEAVKTTVHDLVDALKHAELGYIRELATGFHREVLKAAPAAVDVLALVKSLSAQLSAVQARMTAFETQTPPAV